MDGEKFWQTTLISYQSYKKRNSCLNGNIQTGKSKTSVIKHKFLVMSCQGGVGKTSIAVNLAMAISKRGLSVELMDVNFHSPDIHRMLGLELPIAWETR
jgi:Mrp family chromosome partitioning ATPase